jgi:glycosyltransferase involved in cell wall biosynthesis
MRAAAPAVRRPVYFCFANPAGFSGQKAATEHVMKGLTHRGWLCRSLPQPVLDRTGGGRLAPVRYLLGLVGAWIRSSGLLFARGGWLCVNLGQTRTAFVRDAVPLLLGRAGVGRARVVISLHGSLFMSWPDESLNVRVFRFLLHHAAVITVLGERQRRRLIALGIPDDRVQVVVNSCELEPVSDWAVAAKHRRPTGSDPVWHCLFLSSLIDTKGFPEYLEALQRLAAQPGPRIDAVLCGRVVSTEFSVRFPDPASAEAWIGEQLAEINRSPRVQARWIKGAAGAQKTALFRHADIFVLPTRYAVEAQPLVLLEAMASGCAIITTRAGEIPTILDEQSAVLLAEPSTDALATALQSLLADPAARTRLARAAHARFVQCYQSDRHIDAWEKLLAESGARNDAALLAHPAN